MPVHGSGTTSTGRNGGTPTRRTAARTFLTALAGGWSRDGLTLPGARDMEWNPYGDSCYGKSPSAMVTWIRDFLNRCKARTGRDAVICTATSWGTRCTGIHSGFGAMSPLWVARYDTTPGTLPADRPYQTMWRYTSTGPVVGDHNKFDGAPARLVALANG